MGGFPGSKLHSRDTKMQSELGAKIASLASRQLKKNVLLELVVFLVVLHYVF